MAGRITIKEIADKAGVSIGTVDRVLHDRGRVAEKTKSKILAIAEAGNYSSNISARLLRLNRLFKLATFMPSNLSYWTQQLKGVEEAVKEYESIGFRHRHYSLESILLTETENILGQIINDKPDGIILTPYCLSKPTLLSKLQDSGIPFVFVDVNRENAGQLMYVGQNPFLGGKMAASLLDLGYLDDYELFIVTSKREDLNNEAIVSRIEGLNSFYKEKDSKVQVHNINLAEAGLDQSDLLKQLKSVEKNVHLFIPNSRSYELVEYLKDHKKSMKLRMVGYDLVEENISGLKSGIIDFIIDQQPYNQGKLAVQALYKKLVLKHPVDPIHPIPIDIITSHNLRDR